MWTAANLMWLPQMVPWPQLYGEPHQCVETTMARQQVNPTLLPLAPWATVVFGSRIVWRCYHCQRRWNSWHPMVILLVIVWLSLVRYNSEYLCTDIYIYIYVHTWVSPCTYVIRHPPPWCATSQLLAIFQVGQNTLQDGNGKSANFEIVSNFFVLHHL